MAHLPLVSPEFSKVAIVLFSKHLEIKDMAELSRVNKQIRIFVLEILFNRLKLDRPLDLPSDRLGTFLNATVINLRLFIRNPFRKAAGQPHFPALSQIPGFQPDPSNIILDVNKMTSIHIVALSSLELLDFCLDSQARDEKGVLELYQEACHLKHLDMARHILGRILLPESTFLKKSFDLICALYHEKQPSSENPEELRQQFLNDVQPIFIRLEKKSDAFLVEIEKHSRSFKVKKKDYKEGKSFDPAKSLLEAQGGLARLEQISSENEELVSLSDALLKLLHNPRIPLTAGNHYSFFLELLCSTYRAGDLRANVRFTLTQLVEGKIVLRILEELYEKSHEKLFEAACASGSVEMIEYFFQSLGTPTTSNFKAAHLVTAYRLGRGQQMFDIMLRDFESRTEVLKGAYATKDIAFIDSCRQQLDLNSVPDPLELSYACQTDDPAIVTHALTHIKRTNCNKDAASKIVCESGNLSILELLIKENLFFLNPTIDAPAFLGTLFHEAEKRGQSKQLLALIEGIPDAYKRYIICSKAYVKADESSKSANYHQTQARIRSEQDLMRAIQSGNLEAVKPLMPKDAIPPAVLQQVVTCAALGSSQHLDILLHFMQNGLKLTHQGNDTISDLFMAASRHGHLEAAKALVRQAFEKGSQCKQKLQDHQGRYLEVALVCGNPEMTRFIRAVAVHGNLNFNEFMRKLESKQLEYSGWEKFKAFWALSG